MRKKKQRSYAKH